MSTWYEVKVVRYDSYGNVARGWIALSSDSGRPFFWQRFRNDATPYCCRFTTFAEAEKVAEQFQDAMAVGLSQYYEVHFPTRRDARGRKRPLLKGDCEIIIAEFWYGWKA